MVKEEIKAFLGNRRISQAVVAQVTGEGMHTESRLLISFVCPAHLYKYVKI